MNKGGRKIKLDIWCKVKDASQTFHLGFEIVKQRSMK
jgi:hypothetical protein